MPPKGANAVRSNPIPPPTSQQRPWSELTTSGDEVQPVLDANELLEIRRMVTARQQLLTESSNYTLWHTNLLRVLAQYKLEQHII